MLSASPSVSQSVGPQPVEHRLQEARRVRSELIVAVLQGRPVEPELATRAYIALEDLINTVGALLDENDALTAECHHLGHDWDQDEEPDLPALVEANSAA